MANVLETAKVQVILALVLLSYHLKYLLVIMFNLILSTIVQKGLNTDSNSWTQEAVFEGMSKYEKSRLPHLNKYKFINCIFRFKLDSQILHPIIVEW